MNKHLEYQEGGSHYKDLKIQPAEMCLANLSREELVGVLKWMTTKYIWRNKDDVREDWNKTVQYIQMIKEEIDNRTAEPPLTDKIVPDRREKADRPLLGFPSTVFVKENTVAEQLNHIVSECRECVAAYDAREPYRRVIEEAFDVAHSLATLCEIDPTYTKGIYSTVLEKNKKRGYYD